MSMEAAVKHPGEPPDEGWFVQERPELLYPGGIVRRKAAARGSLFGCPGSADQAANLLSLPWGGE
jgi:hypothetical protein